MIGGICFRHSIKNNLALVFCFFTKMRSIAVCAGLYVIISLVTKSLYVLLYEVIKSLIQFVLLKSPKIISRSALSKCLATRSSISFSPCKVGLVDN